MITEHNFDYIQEYRAKMKKEKLQLELESLVERSGYSIRKERGTFSGDHCVIEGEKLVVLNTKKPPEQQIGLLYRILKKAELEDLYVKPAVRKELDLLRQQLEKFEGKQNQTLVSFTE